MFPLTKFFFVCNFPAIIVVRVWLLISKEMLVSFGLFEMNVVVEIITNAVNQIFVNIFKF